MMRRFILGWEIQKTSFSGGGGGGSGGGGGVLCSPYAPSPEETLDLVLNYALMTFLMM